MITPGVDTWGTLEQSNEYFSKRWGADWASLTDIDKEALLVTSYNRLRGLTNYQLPAASDNPQLLQAQFEYAWYLYNYSGAQEKRAALISQGVRRFKALDFEEDYRAAANNVPSEITDLLNDFVNVGSAFVEINRKNE